MASSGHSPASSSGQPRNTPPSTDCAYSSESGTIVAPGSRASQTTTAGPDSYSCPPASTASAVAASTCGTRSSSASPSRAGRTGVSWLPDTNTTARSAAFEPKPARASAAAAWSAAVMSASVETPTAQRTRVSFMVDPSCVAIAGEYRRQTTISVNDSTGSCTNSPPGSRLPGRIASAVAMPAVRAASSSAPTSLTNRICRGSIPMSAAIFA